MYQEQLLADGMVSGDCPHIRTDKMFLRMGRRCVYHSVERISVQRDKTILESQIESMKAWVDYIRRIDGDHHG